MTTIKDIAKILVNRHHLKSNDAETFLLQMVEVINEGLLQDRQVKIKGFGTFKLQTVKERSSVNISTGERVTISEHDKITFTPDNVMRDLINKPFAQFETITIDSDTVVSELEQMNKKDEELEIMEDETTVDTSEPEDINEESVSVLTENAVTSTLYTADITNDAADDTVSAAEDAVEEVAEEVAEVSTEDIQETSTEEVEKEDFIETEETIETEHGTMADSPEEETDDAINTAVITEEIKDDDIENLPKEESIEEEEEEENDVVEEEENKEAKEKVVENGDDEEEEEDDDDDDDDDDEYEEGFFDTFSENAFNAHSLLLSAAVAALFFFLGYYCSQHGVFGNPVNTNVVDSSTIATQTPISQEQAVNANSDVAKMQTDSVVTKEKEESDKVGSKTDDDSNDDNMSEYNDDVRIRTGAYVIVGTEREVKVREGQTIKSISKANLGPDMECYVEAYNHTKTVKAGQVIKIPKLKLKKKRQK